MNEKPCDPEDLRVVYGGLIDNFHSVIQVRFALAGLFLAATGLLFSAFLTGGMPQAEKEAVTILGLGLSVIAWLLEGRNRSLLCNLSKVGGDLETRLHLGGAMGFFAFANMPPVMPRLPFSEKRLGPEHPLSKLISHTFVLNLLYAGVSLLWFLTFLYVLRTHYSPAAPGLKP